MNQIFFEMTMFGSYNSSSSISNSEEISHSHVVMVSYFPRLA